jgi:hypothetical protein
MPKKMLLLAIVVVALAAPAAASADQWTGEGETIGAEEAVSESYEGFISFTTPSPPLPVHSTFGCEMTMRIVVFGSESGTGNASVSEFGANPLTCKGTGIFAECLLSADSYLGFGSVDINASDLTFTGPITMTNFYWGKCPVQASHLTFNSVTATTTNGVLGGISHISLSGTATNGASKISGTMQNENSFGLGGALGIDY